MELNGNLMKMRTVLEEPVRYFLKLGEQEVCMNDFLGRSVAFGYNGVINCIHCGKRTKKSFSQGFCYNCMLTAPEADQSIFRPELSRAQFGEARDLKWSEEHDLIPHYVYLAVTNDLKVGVTRYNQIPTRWIDQGAVQAMILAITPNRHIAGVIENYLKGFVADITHWQAMLKDKINTDVDLMLERERVIALLPEELKKYVESSVSVQKIIYPGSFQLGKIKSLSLDKTPEIEGKLVRIKGQYLIFDNGSVLNIRKHNGYYVNFKIID